jgi:acyl dehydratase
MRPYELTAHNTATQSDNKIHDDSVARQYGFAGGLVPGVDTYAYLTHPVAEAWGLRWLERGRMRGRFVSPVYDGRRTLVTAVETEGGAVDLEVLDETGLRCATGWASPAPTLVLLPDLADYPAAPLPTTRVPAAAESVSKLSVLGSIGATFHAEKAAAYLADIGEELPVYADEGVAHPGWLLRWANWILAANVELGPWIHVESDVQHLGLVHDGERVDVRGRVQEVFERKGHDFVVLDLVLVAERTRPVQHITHTAIFRPRTIA